MFLREYKVLFRHFQRINHQQIIKLNLSTTPKTSLPHRSSSTFSEEEETVILETINKCHPSDFVKYDIKEGQLKKLLAQREKTGGFGDFDDVLMTQDVASLIKFCKSILNGGKRIRNVKSGSSTKGICTPAISDATKCMIKSIMGLHVWGNTVSWALLENDGQINHWDSEKFDNLFKMNTVSLVDAITDLTLQLPCADAYVMESDGYTALGKMKSSTFYLHLQRQQMIAMIMSGIKMRRCITSGIPDPTNNFYLMQSRSPAKLFKLNLGTETVSAENVISKIISDQQAMYLPQLPPIIIDPNVINKYTSYEISVREQMHSVLLLTLAFYNQIYVPKNEKIEMINS